MYSRTEFTGALQQLVYAVVHTIELVIKRGACVRVSPAILSLEECFNNRYRYFFFVAGEYFTVKQWPYTSTWEIAVRREEPRRREYLT